MKKILLFTFIGISAIQLASAQDTIWSQKSGASSHSAYSVALSNDGTKAFSGSECHPASLRMFNAASGDLLWNYDLSGSLMCITSVKFSSSGNIIAGLEEFGNLLIFDYSGATPILSKALSTTTAGAFALDFSDDGTKVAIGCISSKLVIIDLVSEVELHNINAHSTWVQSVDWQNDKIVTGGTDNLVKLWDSAGNYIRSFTGHTDDVLSVQFSKDGKYILSTSADKTIKLWDIATGLIIRTFSGHTNEVMQAVISNDGEKIISGSKDSTIKVWDAMSGTTTMSFSKKNSGWVNSVSFSTNGKHILAGTASGDVQMWDITLPTSINESSKNNNCIIYPNPAKDIITVSSSTAQIASVSVTNVTGIVQQIPNLYSTNNILIDVSSLSKGLYFVHINTKNGEHFYKSFLKN